MLCVGQNMDSESEHEEKSEHEEESEMGCHEPFDLDLSHKYKIRELEEELKALKFSHQHLKWHCMMYRKALQDTESGCEALGKTLHDYRNNPPSYPSCTCCEYEDLNQTLQELRENTQQFSTTETDEKGKGCSSCMNDALLLEISTVQKNSRSLDMFDDSIAGS